MAARFSATMRSLSFTRRNKRGSEAGGAEQLSVAAVPVGTHGGQVSHAGGQLSVHAGLPHELDVNNVASRSSRIPFTRKRSESRNGSFSTRPSGDDPLPPSTVRVTTVDGAALVLPMTLHTTVGQLVRTCASELGLADGQHSSFALYSLKHDGTHLLLRDELPVSAILQAKPSARQQMRSLLNPGASTTPRLLFKKRLYVKTDEALMMTSPRFLHLIFIQAVDEVLRGTLNVSLSDAVKLASILYYVKFGPYRAEGKEFTARYVAENQLIAQLVPSTLLVKHTDKEWATKILNSHQKISGLFTQLTAEGNVFVTEDESKRTYLKKVAKMPLYGMSLYSVHNPHLFPSGAFVLGCHAAGISMMHPLTRAELHSPFQFADVIKWEYTPREFCFWSTRCDFLSPRKQGRHIVKYALATKQGWEVSAALHSYYKMYMNVEVKIKSHERERQAVNVSQAAPVDGSGAPAADEEGDDSDGGEEANEAGSKTTAVTFEPESKRSRRKRDQVSSAFSPPGVARGSSVQSSARRREEAKVEAPPIGGGALYGDMPPPEAQAGAAAGLGPLPQWVQKGTEVVGSSPPPRSAAPTVTIDLPDTPASERTGRGSEEEGEEGKSDPIPQDVIDKFKAAGIYVTALSDDEDDEPEEKINSLPQSPSPLVNATPRASNKKMKALKVANTQL